MKKPEHTTISMQPRLLRMRDAPAYLGMSERTFNQVVRPNIREVVIGVQGVAFDREELDRWADKFMEENAVEKPGQVERSIRSGEPKPKRRPPTFTVKAANTDKSSFQNALDAARKKRTR
jgi:predicted DNA-binding transcriptional regulator AlpA